MTNIETTDGVWGLGDWTELVWFRPDGSRLSSVRNSPPSAIRCAWLSTDDTCVFDQALLTSLGFRGAYGGCDRARRPVFWGTIRELNLACLVDQSTREATTRGIQRHVVLLLDEMKRMQSVETHSLSQASLVLDVSGVGWHHICVETFTLVRELVSIYEQWFPDSLGVVLLINCPFIMPIMWPLIAAILPRHLQQRIHLVAGQCDNTSDAQILLAQWIGGDACESFAARSMMLPASVSR